MPTTSLKRSKTVFHGKGRPARAALSKTKALEGTALYKEPSRSQVFAVTGRGRRGARASY